MVIHRKQNPQAELLPMHHQLKSKLVTLITISQKLQTEKKKKDNVSEFIEKMEKRLTNYIPQNND